MRCFIFKQRLLDSHTATKELFLLLHFAQANLTELKSFGKPPPAVVNVTAAVMVLLSPPTKIPKDRSWNAAKVMMGKVRVENNDTESYTIYI